VHLDVGEPESWQQALARCQHHFGPVDVLVNNAAIFLFRPLDQTERDQFERVLRVNVVGTFLGIQACARIMRARGGCAIVNVASTDSLKGRELIAAYATSK
jgi:3alpha(or 20beta)-hydroxysteroid dehydrogenase